MQDKSLLILNGTGLTNLSSVREKCLALCDELGLQLDFRQTDDPNQMSRWITRDSAEFDTLLINPAGGSKSGASELKMYRSAMEKIADIRKPVIEVHMTNVFEPSDALTIPLQGPKRDMGLVCGMGFNSYLLAIRAVARRLQG